jgi:cytidylate kinase
MPIIIISRLSYTSGEAIAHGLASRLGYECLADEVFPEAASRSGIPVGKLRQALEEAPSLFGMAPSARKRLIAHLQAALLRRLLPDNVVFHGPFAHCLVQGISHVLKVRVFAHVQDRVALKVKQEGGSTREAGKAIVATDRARLLLAKLAFGVDDDDPSLFDLVLNTSQVDPETAIGLIAETVGHKRYQPMTYSQKCLENLELSQRARAALVDLDPEVVVQAESGQLRIRTRSAGRGKARRLAQIRERVATLSGVSGVEVETVADLLDHLTGSFR